jgi:predicted phosphodiesterase
MRVAVLSDIHGNLPALAAVLRDVAQAGVDAIVLNGDLADGPMPAETMDALLGLGDQAVWIRGNSDRWLAEAYDGTFKPSGMATSPPVEFFSWCAGRITAAHRDQLAALPLSVTLDIDGLGPVAFCHGTARDDNEFILVDSPMAQYQAAFAAAPEQTFVLGHTHMPFDRLAGTRRFVNAGSVGMGYGHQGASWALLGPEVTLRRTGYDTEAVATELAAAAPDLPDIEFISGNVRQSASDADALAAFTETAGKQAQLRETAPPDGPSGS